MSPRFSIIIPTHNVEKYIARCVESCVNQTFMDIEIIIVDDCGADNSISIAQNYAKSDPRVKIIRNPKNLGRFHARISGINNAKGQYLLFLDADDFMALNTCELLESKIQNEILSSQTPPDIVHFKSDFVDNKNSSALAYILHKIRYLLPTRFSKSKLENTQIAHNFFLSSYHFPKFTLWDKAYRKELVRKAVGLLECVENPLNMGEDMLTFFVIALLAKKYVSVESRLYKYCLNATSITKDNSKENILKRQNDMTYVCEILAKLGQNERLKEHRECEKIIARITNNLKSLIILEERFGAENGKSLYLKKCAKSLKYWNRNLTYLRILAYIVSFRKIKI
ncbi:hypothetical protein CCY99_07450 [Helicobacter sp. 16-1353]|uniref:glycosyltransferase family 2 protein n=1 Tax=Helicobacter sp. 16-1353 TaxID=2004996 RepID=UPI000DCEE733|nr:glycosyltransferase family 2 protein [Helicobacter sp. 16-1353]RAX52473.1 hypothetical protein CCY99_07450 [Helicobacter sp. 16-1353]